MLLRHLLTFGNRSDPSYAHGFIKLWVIPLNPDLPRYGGRTGREYRKGSEGHSALGGSADAIQVDTFILFTKKKKGSRESNGGRGPYQGGGRYFVICARNPEFLVTPLLTGDRSAYIARVGLKSLDVAF